jgi:hypothetical protein
MYKSSKSTGNIIIYFHQSSKLLQNFSEIWSMQILAIVDRAYGQADRHTIWEFAIKTLGIFSHVCQ